MISDILWYLQYRNGVYVQFMANSRNSSPSLSDFIQIVAPCGDHLGGDDRLLHSVLSIPNEEQRDRDTKRPNGGNLNRCKSALLKQSPFTDLRIVSLMFDKCHSNLGC